jgi:hypothetical protein
MNLNETGCEDIENIPFFVSGYRLRLISYEPDSEPLGSMKGKKFLD